MTLCHIKKKIQLIFWERSFEIFTVSPNSLGIFWERLELRNRASAVHVEVPDGILGISRQAWQGLQSKTPENYDQPLPTTKIL